MDTIYKLENGEVIINEDMLNHKLVKALIRRDRGGLIAGDMKGLKKERAFAELSLVWYCINLNSPGIAKGKEGEELVKDGMDEYGLPPEWKPDDAYNAWYNWYEQYYNDIIGVKTIKSIISGLTRSVNMMNKVSGIMNTIESQIDTDADNAIEALANFNKLNKEIMNTAADMPGTIIKLKELETKYLKDERKVKVGRGGKVITSSMIPKR